MQSLKERKTSFSMRKIPVLKTNEEVPAIVENLDDIKILEICNAIDKWEQEVLFSENGFYSLKGKNVENKTKEFSKELSFFISGLISKIKFTEKTSKLIISTIKKSKLETIKKQMQLYESQELKNWEIEVYENSITSSIQRAILYKNNPEIVHLSYQNGLEIIINMAKKEKWNRKILIAKKQNFESEFYFSLINAFIKDKDVNSSLYFEKYKDKINKNDKETLELSLNELKNNVLAYNIAKEIISYDLSELETEKYIKSVEDKDVKSIVKTIINDFFEDKKKNKNKEIDEKNEQNWQEILSVFSSEPDKAFLYIDITLDKNSTKSKQSYIKNMRKNGFISTDKQKFLSILKDYVEDFYKFKNKSISDYREFLSEEDYKLVESIKQFTQDDFNFFVADFNYISQSLLEKGINSNDDIYDFVKFLFSIKNNYVQINKKELDIEARNKLIKCALERIIVKKNKIKE